MKPFNQNLKNKFKQTYNKQLHQTIQSNNSIKQFNETIQSHNCIKLFNQTVQ